MRLPALLLTATVLAATGCTWVPMAPEASAVRVVPMGAAPAGCQVQQEIEVSVTGKIGFWERNTLRVREELETLARKNKVSDVIILICNQTYVNISERMDSIDKCSIEWSFTSG